jgi:8-oxo-dGTP pyrophosphatase MutT (NUDIX family)
LDYRSIFAVHRRAEVAMVIRPNPEWVFLQTKTHYPTGTFRLPTGAMKAGEQPEQTMLRELQEETNLIPGRYQPLFRLDYLVEGARQDFYTTAYLIEDPQGQLKSNDPSEGISAWRQAHISDLYAVAHELRQMEAPWIGWGIYRSAIHQLTAELLSKQTEECST